MNEINIRYGETLTLPIDADDSTATGATLYVGLAGETPVITSATTLTNGVGVFELSTEETQIPLGKYYYQVTVVDENGNISKYPEPSNCADCTEGGLPAFVVSEALDAQEVVS